MEDNRFVKKAFFDHLLRTGFTQEHVDVYHEYFDFFLEHVGQAKLMDLEPEVVYRVGLDTVQDLDGEDVVEAFLQLMEYFIGWWAERWEAMHPFEDDGEEQKNFSDSTPQEE